MSLLNVEDVVRMVVVALGCYLIYASYKKCDKNNKKVKVIIRLLAVVALATILKAFYSGNFAICGLDYFSNAAVVVILHILVLAATSQLGANCAQVNKKHCSDCKKDSESKCSNSDWNSSSTESSSTCNSSTDSKSDTFSSCKKCKSSSSSSSSSTCSSSSSSSCSSSW